MRRNMSYRKPVPVYIPSPPQSPSAKEEELDYDYNFLPEAPPLPSEWREAIERALSSDHNAVSYPPTAPSPGSSSESDYPHRQRQQVSRDNHDLECSIFSRRTTLVTRESMFSAAGLSQEERTQRHPHHIYRPPTPPLPTYRPKRRKTDSKGEWWDSYTTLSEIHHEEGRVASTAMRLQSSRSTGRTLITTPVKEGRLMMFANHSCTPVTPDGDREATWTKSIKKVCDVLVTKLEKGMKWLRC